MLLPGDGLEYLSTKKTLPIGKIFLGERFLSHSSRPSLPDDSPILPHPKFLHIVCIFTKKHRNGECQIPTAKVRRLQNATKLVG